ncbi:butyrophilin subfamily 3 member A2-like [Spea bombifrons]|uniref:butyrophilin subfamily 3 member A2-like n=1 Tax=Spea bombifrons TaxID=233779 RepID=UPI00234989F1|nr:butyrophilin subfamily 3 member A2-like [Spea bombifrons]
MERIVIVGHLMNNKSESSGHRRNGPSFSFSFRSGEDPSISAMERLFRVSGSLLLLLTSMLSEASVQNASFYESVVLPCEFPFVSGRDDLQVSWFFVKDVNEEPLVVHSLINGQDRSEAQSSQFRGRTSIPGLSNGKLDLTLERVDFSDEGVYTCSAATTKGHGDIETRLRINRLEADDPAVVLRYVDGQRQLKCTATGWFKDPRVQWRNRDHEDLSEYARTSVSDLPDGRQTVESVLESNVEENVHYFCQIKEGRLKRSVRAVISDGNHAVTLKDEI